MRPAIEVRGLTKRYRDRLVLDGVTLTVPWGAVTGFAGINGAGKTTTLRCILGFERGEGAVRVAGTAYRDLEQPLRTVGFCPDALGAAASSTVRAHLRTIALRAGVDDASVDDALRSVGLESVSTAVRDFSLGMRRRLAIAGALVARPRILVLDEPFDGLDPEGRRWLAERLRSHADAGGAVLLSAHALDEIEPLLDRLVCLHEGSTRYEGATDEFLREHAASVTIVRSADQARLADALRHAGATVHGRAADAIAVRGLPAEQIARIGAEASILITELTPRRLSLSGAFAATIHAGAA